jgi:PPP family 3-phenylpropionic acid transporter
VGILWSLGVAAEIAIFIFLPKINARFTPQVLFSFSFLVTACRYLLVGWFPGSLALQLIAQVGHAFTYGAWHAATMAMLHQWFPAQLGARGQAIYTSFAFGLGGALGGVSAGVAWESIGAAWMFTAMSALMFIACGISHRWVRA